MADSGRPLPRLTGAEIIRKLTHTAAFAPALLLPRLGPALSLALAGLLFLVNAFVLPWAAPWLYRSGEPGMGALEIVLYPAAVAACVLAYSGAGSHAWYLVPMAAWFCLAFVDALMGLACRALRAGPRLPWNDRKPVAGTLAGLAGALAAGLAAAALFLPAPAATGWISLALLLLAAALAETLWFGVADNLTVPFAVCVLAPLLASPLFHPPAQACVTCVLPWYSLAAPAAFGLVAYAGRMLTAGGALLGALLAFLLMAAEPGLFLFLGGFFALGMLATRFGFARKAARGIAEARGGRRGAAEVFGAMGAAAWMTPLVHAAGADAQARKAALLVCAAPFVAKTMDTVASETGKALGGATISLRSLRRVEPGAEGGVSLAGTACGLLAAGLPALLPLMLGWGNLGDTLLLLAAALGANLFESLWGEWAARRGLDQGPHTNFLMTLVAALIAWFFWIRA